MPARLFAFLCLASAVSLPATPRFTEVSTQLGLPRLDASRLAVVDLDGDGHDDLVLRPNSANDAAPLVHLWVCGDGPAAGRFKRAPAPGLPPLSPRDVLTFADLDNDGRADAIVGRHLDYLQETFAPPALPPFRTAWFRGRGDGTFEPPRHLEDAPAATTAAIAVGDVNRDGLPDLWLGNWYEKYFSGYDAFANDLLLQYPRFDDNLGFVRWPLPGESLPADRAIDPGGRPTYGTVIAHLDDGPLPHLLELNYGRRWNRLYALAPAAPLVLLPASPGVAAPPLRPGGSALFRCEEIRRSLRGAEIAPAAGFDGDTIRHGRHPDWVALRGKVDPRFDRPDEPPFRANGNDFDAAVGDLDNDGDFDVFVTTIIHAWAGDSSDRSRFLVNRLGESGRLVFDSPAGLSVDRIPDEITDENRNYNQGDIFAELGDLDNDGRLDLVLCSSDYNDPPPHDERLRIFLQQPDGTFRDATAALGLDHLGAGQPAWIDANRDGFLDLVVGQTFNRFDIERRRQAGLANGTLTANGDDDAGAHPVVHFYFNSPVPGRHGLVLRLRGDPAQGVARDAFGALVRLEADLDGDPATPPTRLLRQQAGPGGHAGKRSGTFVHFGLGAAPAATDIAIVWPNGARTETRLPRLAAGSYEIDLATGARPERLP